MSSPSSVITQGYGTWGTPSLVITLGFASSVVVFVASISVTLTDVLNVAIPNLTGLRWAWWDSPLLNTQIAPVMQGTGASTNGSGVFSITTLSGSALTAGQAGWLEVTDSDGTPGQSPIGKVAAGPIVVN